MMQLDDGNYYSPEMGKYYFSVSQYKSFCKCEGMAMAEIRGEYKRPLTKALLVGSFIDRYFEGTLDEFISGNPEIFTRKNELRAEFKKANEIIGRIKSDPLFMQFMGGEKQKILTFEFCGAPWKMKMDSYIPDVCITDLKIVANFRTLPLWRYDLQGAIYAEGVRANGLGDLPFYLAVATKEKTPDLDIFQIPRPTLDMALREIEGKMPHFIAVKQGFEEPRYCGKCDYCKAVKRARVRNYNELLADK